VTVTGGVLLESVYVVVNRILYTVMLLEKIRHTRGMLYCTHDESCKFLSISSVEQRHSVKCAGH